MRSSIGEEKANRNPHLPVWKLILSACLKNVYSGSESKHDAEEHASRPVTIESHRYSDKNKGFVSEALLPGLVSNFSSLMQPYGDSITQRW